MAAHKVKLSRRRPRLGDVDLEQQVRDSAEYERRLKALQVELLKIQQAYLQQGRHAVLLFEGWDAAGKGGAVRQLTTSMDPRGYKVWPIGTPDPREQGVHYLYRFWRRMPEPGTLAIFDRSWYGRVLVERVDQLVEKAAWKRAYDEINEFERMLVDNGMRVIKLFFHVSPEVQLKRLVERIETPYKHWKISLDDFHNRSKRPDYEKAIGEMFERTSTQQAPWHIVPSEHKWFGRLDALKYVAKRLSEGVDLTPAPLDPALREAAIAAQRKARRSK